MNILTTSGLVERWIGDEVVFKNLKIGLGAPNCPGDIMTLSGAVSEVADDGTITIGYIGRNSRGAHVTGSDEIALYSGAARYVLAYRAFNERSWHRFGQGVQNALGSPEAFDVSFGWTTPFGLLTPAQWIAMFATRYMHEYGATSEDFGRVAAADRKHAANIPHAFFHGRPITLEDDQAPPHRVWPTTST